MKILEQTGAVFLDRDGTLTRQHEYTWKKSQLQLQIGVASFIRFLNNKKIPVIVITNQGVVARGLVSIKGVNLLHQIIQGLLKKEEAHIDAFYFCPHHPKGTIIKYSRVCSCRKPKTGLFKKAGKDFSINFKKSFMIGDMTQDILAGKRAGTKTILLKKGHKGMDGKYVVKAEYEAKNFRQVLRIFKKNDFF